MARCRVGSEVTSRLESDSGARVTSAEAAREEKPTPSPFVRHFTSFVPKLLCFPLVDGLLGP